MNKPVDCKHGVDDGACKECYLETTNLQAKIDNLYENNARLDAEIEALKKEAALQRLSDFTQEAECEPVAWNEEEFNAIAYNYRSWPMHDPKGVLERYEELVNYVQSITHPVKELTDEEIIEIWTEFDNKDADDYFIAIAREILRKASEK